ncbi:hypothetical protein M2650_13160 [Luteimonas sp. SX5]|uniref:DUF3732 domain-containing protein n=1 Tax=Luteimonas galliterrae TaxID=2940486 RepID=A0ABT0ML19_9GAMM|nr:hypothetical protein [Luteimonas galliterrae]MCL1635571.1 hypothetical protein [Luteimonas galliterrae]
MRDCLWFLLGGDKVPKKIPQALGYDQLRLLISNDSDQYEISRALAGGDTRIYRVLDEVREAIDEEVNTFIVRLSGASGKQLLRSSSKKGNVTGGDLRHWFLLSQPSMISEDPTSGPQMNSTQRMAAFHLFLTGSDDAAIQLKKTKAEQDRIAGQIAATEQHLEHISREIPSGLTREHVAGALEHVDTALNAMTEHYNLRSAQLKSVRNSILESAGSYAKAEQDRDLSLMMIQRFELLDQKYLSDYERLGATWEGISMFQALDETPCPLCGTPVELQLDPKQLNSENQNLYRKALSAELDKIRNLRVGLSLTLKHERERANFLSETTQSLSIRLNELEKQEKRQINETRNEFTGDPKTLAIRRSELSENLAKFDEKARLEASIVRLKSTKRRERFSIERNVGDSPSEVANLAKSYLHDWGFTGIKDVSLDMNMCDLRIDDRARLDYGAGKRSIFLTALTISVISHALQNGYPNLGFVVIDSPLKSYADPKNAADRDIPASTVTDRFYRWLADWNGPGQIVILENQEISEPDRTTIDAIEFIGDAVGDGRRGFYP